VATVEELIHSAKKLFADHGDSLLKDEAVRAHLSEYQDKITATNRMMQHSEIVSCCSVCAQDTAGSCCMRDVEEWYDPILLLINLLMGAELPNFREIPGHCLFVGNNGCKLVARYSFCVNYLCPRLKDLLGTSQTEHLTAVAGEELYSGWTAEKSIRQWLSSHSVEFC